MLAAEPAPARIVEVHLAAMALRGAEIVSVRGFAGDPLARRTLLTWLHEQGLDSLENELTATSHGIERRAR